MRWATERRATVGLARAGAAAAFAWLAAAAAVTASYEWFGGPSPEHLASSPWHVWHGDEWRLFTSMFPISRFAVLELLGCLLAVVVALRLVGGLVFWIVAIVAHVGATLVVYAAIGVLWLVDRSAVTEAVTDPDYGISAVWMGAIGAISVALAVRGRRRDAAAVAGTTVAVCLGLIWVSGGVAAAEHLLALALGALTARPLLRAQPPGRWLNRRKLGSWPSARSAATLVRGRSSARSNSR